MTTFYDNSFRKVHLVTMRFINPIVRENFDSLYKMSFVDNRKNDLILIRTPEKQDKTLELSQHWSADSTLARNEVIMKMT